MLNVRFNIKKKRALQMNAGPLIGSLLVNLLYYQLLHAREGAGL